MTYRPKLKSVNKVVLKYLDFLHMNKAVKRVLTFNPMTSFRSASSDVFRDFSGRLISAWGLGWFVMPPCGSRAKPWWGPGAAKLSEGERISYSEITYF